MWKGRLFYRKWIGVRAISTHKQVNDSLKEVLLGGEKGKLYKDRTTKGRISSRRFSHSAGRIHWYGRRVNTAIFLTEVKKLNRDSNKKRISKGLFSSTSEVVQSALWRNWSSRVKNIGKFHLRSGYNWVEISCTLVSAMKPRPEEQVEVVKSWTILWRKNPWES